MGSLSYYTFIKKWKSASLIPRSFSLSVFDRLQHANTVGVGLRDLVKCAAIRWTDGRHTGGSAQQIISMSFFVLSVQRLDVRAFARQMTNTKGASSRRRRRAPPPHVFTICLPDGSARDQILGVFPHRICILQAIKYWLWERPGNEARQSGGNGLFRM